MKHFLSTIVTLLITVVVSGQSTSAEDALKAQQSAAERRQQSLQTQKDSVNNGVFNVEALLEDVESNRPVAVPRLVIPTEIKYGTLSDEELISLIEKSDIDAIIQLSDRYINEDNFKESAYWLMKGVNLKSTECMIKMGDLCKDSYHDMRSAMKWYIRAYENNNPTENNNARRRGGLAEKIGNYYASEEVAMLDSAIFWYEKAYKLSNKRWGETTIASIYLKKGNTIEAYKWFIKGNESKIRIANKFYNAKFYQEAFNLYSDLPNDKEAQYMMGYMLLHGQGTYKNEREARRLFEKAADKTNRELLGKNSKGIDNHIFICEDDNYDIESCLGDIDSIYTWPVNANSYSSHKYFYYFSDYLSTYHCKNDQGYAPALYQLGIFEELSGHFIEAADYYRRAIAKLNVDAKVALARLLIYDKVAPLEHEQSAMKLFDEAFADGNVNAKLLYAKMYDDGVGVVEKNPAEAVYWYTQAAEQGSVEAQAHLGCIYMYGKNSFPVFDKAVYWLEKAADQNDADSQNRLGELYERGLGVPQKYLVAKDFYEKAATNSDYKSHEAQYNLGRMYDYGIGKVKMNPQQAVRWYQEAAESGYAPALTRLGVKWREGDGVPQRDNKEALKNIQKAAEQGYAPAYWELGNCYRYGNGVDVSSKMALRYFLKAAQSVESDTDVEYWFLLGELYDLGTYAKPNYKEAFKWYKKAADRGHVKAQLRIAQYYDFGGKYVKKDPSLAFNGYLTAANLKDMESMERVAEMYEQGIGTFKNTEEAERWKHELEETKKNKAESLKDKICSINVLQPTKGDRLHDTHVVLEYEAVNMDMSSWVLNLRVKREDLTYSVRADDGETNRHIIEFDLPDVNGDYDIQLCATNKDRQSVWTESITFTYEQAPKPDIWILSVGVSKYNDKSFAPVKFAVDEATEFEQIIKNYSGKMGENYGSIHPYRLFNEDATRNNIISKLEEIEGLMRERDRVYLFFSGHGEEMHTREKSFFASQDAFAKKDYSGVTFDIINERIKRMKQKGVVLIFMDACHSGNLLPNIISGDKLDNFAMQKGCVYFLSCTGEQESYELDDVHHGVFTHALFEGLKGKAQNEFGEVTTKSLYEYLKVQVPEYAKTIQREQTPVSSAVDAPEVILFPTKKK